jgi:hypothetical protein
MRKFVIICMLHVVFVGIAYEMEMGRMRSNEHLNKMLHQVHVLSIIHSSFRARNLGFHEKCINQASHNNKGTATTSVNKENHPG